MTNINANFCLIKKKIKNIIQKNNISTKKITILAVSKNQNIHTIEQAILSGINNFAENYIKEGIVKIQKLKKYKNIIWHFIGKIQSNKTKKIAQYFDWCQTLDREKTAILLNYHRKNNILPINVLIQINISGESNKNGVDINNYHNLAKVISLMPHLNLRGIMAMPSIKKNKLEHNTQYKRIQLIFNELKRKYNSIDTLSLGTSSDIQTALISTSNMLRIGRYIFNK